MAATITNPGTVGSYAAYPSATQTFLQTLIETPWSGWSIAQVQALLETCARLSGGANPQAVIGSLLVVTPNGTPSVSNPQVVAGKYSPALTPSVLSAIFAEPPQTTTVSQVGQLLDACKRTSGGSNPNNLLGAVIR